jgi:hypothetical protein
MLRKSDFLNAPRLRSQNIRAQAITDAVERVNQGFANSTFLSKAKVKNKFIYRITSFSDELARISHDRINKNG